MSGSNTGMFSKSKTRKFNPKKKSIVEKQETGATDNGSIQLERSAEKTILTAVTGEERHQLIAEAAYFRAERRSFVSGDELKDWLDAEAEIDSLLLKISPNRNA